jgi:ParB family transcriptional regulator, chromosome partitioning protein
VITGFLITNRYFLPIWKHSAKTLEFFESESMRRRTAPDKQTGAGNRKRTRRKKTLKESIGLSAAEAQVTPAPPAIVELERCIREDGGAVLCSYREPFGGTWLLLAVLPLDQVEPTPYQRDLSDTHMARLMDVISRLGRFLDPIIAVREDTGRYWTPNGHHRLVAMKNLSARSIPAVVIPDRSAAYQILALNTEKAHNLREKALEVSRMYRELAQIEQRSEEDYSLEFEEPALLTLGICYGDRPRFAGGAYHPMLKRVDQFMKIPLGQSLEERKRLAQRLLEIDDIVTEKVKQLKASGLTNPYLKAFVVARINPIRFKPKESTMPSLEETLEKVLTAARKFDPDRIRSEDLAAAGGPPEAAD